MTPNDHSPALGGQQQPAAPRLGGAAAITHIMQALAEDSSTVRRRAVDALAEIGSDDALAILMEALSDENPSVVRRAVKALGAYGWPFDPPPELLDQLMHVWHTAPEEREWLAVLFGRMGDPRPLDLLAHTPALALHTRLWAVSQIGWRSSDEATRQRALGTLVRELGELGETPFVWPGDEQLAAAAREAYAQGEQLAPARVLADLGDPTGADVLMGAFRIAIGQRSNPSRDRLARLRDERPLHLLAERITAGKRELVVSLHHYLRAHPGPLTSEARAALNGLIPTLIPALDATREQQEAALTVLGAAASPEADAVLSAWLDREAHALLGTFAETGRLGGFDPRRLYHLIKPDALDRLRRHPLIAAHAVDALHHWLNTTDEPRNALLCLAYLNDERSLPTFIECAQPDQPFALRATALKGLGSYPHTFDAIITAYGGPLLTKVAAHGALQRIGQAAPLRLIADVRAALPTVEEQLGAVMLRAVAAQHHEAAAELFGGLLGHQVAAYRGVAAYGLGFLPATDPAALRPLLADYGQAGHITLHPVPYRVCDAAAESLARLGHSPF